MRFYPQQTSFSRGEFSGDLKLRQDTKAYASAAAGLANCTLSFEGKAVRAPGWRYRAMHRHCLDAISISGVTATAPNGGTAGNIKDGNDATEVTTSAVGTTNPFVVAHLDLGAATAVTFVDAVNLRLSTGTLSGQFFLQYSTDNSAWSNFGAAINVDASKRTARRFSTAGNVSARYWRLARIGATDLGSATVTFAGLSLWVENSTLSAARRWKFAASSTSLYRVVASDRNLRIFTEAGNEVANIPIPHTSAQLTAANWTQSFDTGLIFHEAVQPWKILRQGADDQWDARAQTFTNIPKFDYGAGTGGTNEVQILTRLADGDSVTTYTITLEGETTAAFTSPTDGSHPTGDELLAPIIQDLLNELNNVNGDIVVEKIDLDGDFRITFAGADGNRPWAAMVVNVVKGDNAMTVSRLTKGVTPGEPVMSVTRGWPRCGAFYQSSLYLGGFAQLQDGILRSVVGEFYNLDDRTDRDDRGFLRRLQGENSGTVLQIYAGPKLLVFTDSGTFYQSEEPITPGNAAFAATNSRGIQASVAVTKCDDATLMVSESGQVLDVAYSLQDSKFVAEPISVLSAHLFSNPVDAASRLPLAANDPNIFAVVNDNGALAMLSSLKSQELTGWTPRTTQGKVLAINDDLTGQFWFVVERTLGSVTERYIESEDAARLTDCAFTQTITPEIFVASAAQTNFTYTFTSPGSDALVGVRRNGQRLSWPSQYTVNRGTKTVTLRSPAAANEVIRVCPMVQTVTGLARFNGASVWAVVDDQPEAAAKTVSGGSLTLDVPADESIEVGLVFVPQIDLLPVQVPLPNGTSYQRSIRIVAATIDVVNTPYLEIRANDGPWRPVSLRNGGANLLDVPLNRAGFTGARRIEGLRGWTREGAFSIRQPYPSPFGVRGVLLEVVI